jgi:class 3 adenylate cyclase
MNTATASGATAAATILIVDDDAINRLVLLTCLEDQGFLVDEAVDGQQALEMLHNRAYDAILLDLEMPVLDGFEVLRRVKEDNHLWHIPIIVISAMDEMNSVLRCIEMGAADHLPKPFDAVLLKARLNASLASKRLHDMELAYLEQIRAEQQRSERLLLNILPAPIAEQLKKGETSIVEHFPAVSVMFIDLVGFTPYVAQHTPAEMLALLNTVFLAFDQLAGQYGLEKIKTIGDAYMVAGGLPLPRPDHLEAVTDMAIDAHREMERLTSEKRIPPFRVRIGIHSGPVVAGVIGRRKFGYDLWGDTVNIASRLHTFAESGGTLVSEEVYLRLKDRYRLTEHGLVQLKGLRDMKAYRLLGK